MIKIKKEGIVLRKTNLIFENDGVLNPAAIKDGDVTYLFYRAVQKGNYSSIGYCTLENHFTVKKRNGVLNPFSLPNSIMNRKVLKIRVL
jgi:hypothetical protein